MQGTLKGSSSPGFASPISGAMRLIETLLWAGALAMGFMSAFLLMGGIGL